MNASASQSAFSLVSMNCFRSLRKSLKARVKPLVSAVVIEAVSLGSNLISCMILQLISSSLHKYSDSMFMSFCARICIRLSKVSSMRSIPEQLVNIRLHENIKMEAFVKNRNVISNPLIQTLNCAIIKLHYLYRGVIFLQVFYRQI